MIVASVASIFKGFEDAGVPDNTALIWSELMDEMNRIQMEDRRSRG